MKLKRLYILVYLSFVLLIVAPIVYTLITVAFLDSSLSDNIQLLNKESFLLLAKSIIVASIIALSSTFFGTIFAFLLYKTKIKFRGFFKLSLLIPLLISPYILAVAWKDFLLLFFNNTSFLSSYTIVILLSISIFAPLSMLIIGSALSNINAQLEETAFVITPFRRVVFKIILPLIKPALITSFVLVFIFSVSEFSIPAFFVVKLFITEIFIQFSAYYNHSLAILQSVFLIFICVLLLLSERKYIADAPFFSVSSKGMNTKSYVLKKTKKIALLFLFIWFFISVVFPFIVLFVQSFKDGTSPIIQAFELLLPSFWTSLGLAFSSALIIVFVGYIAASSIEKRKKSFDWFLLIVFAMPSTILGISFIKFYNHSFLDFIYSSYAILLIAYVGTFSFIATKLIANAIKQIPKSLDEAAQMEGISFFKRQQKILIPLISPTIFVAFILSFIFSFGELGTSIMLYPPGMEIMPIKVFTIMANAPQSLTSSMTLIVFAISLLIISLFYLMIKPILKKTRYFDDKIK